MYIHIWCKDNNKFDICKLFITKSYIFNISIGISADTKAEDFTQKVVVLMFHRDYVTQILQFFLKSFGGNKIITYLCSGIKLNCYAYSIYSIWI